MMRLTRQVIVDRFGGPDVLKVIDVSTPSPRPDQILVRVEAAGVLYGDVMRRTNRYLIETPLPYAPGTEIAGTVVEVGIGASLLRVGDRVLCRVGSQGYSQYALADAAQAIPLPAGIGFAEATALLAQGMTAYLLTHEIMALKGRSVFIESVAGGVGMQMAQMAKTLGATLIIGSASSKEKQAFATENGVDVVVSSVAPGWSERVLDATGGHGVDVAYESSGASFAGLLECLSPFGTLVKFGRGVNERQSLDPSQLVGKNQTLRGFYLPGYFGLSYRLLLDAATQSLIAAVLSGTLKIKISQRFSLDDAALAHRAIEERRTIGKVVLEPWTARK